MSDTQNTEENLTPEDLQREEEALKEPIQGDIRSQVIEKYGLSEEQSELVDQLVSDQLEQRKAFGKAIKQKRAWREKAEKAKPVPPREQPKAPEADVNIPELVRKQLDENWLDDSDIPEELRPEVRKLAVLHGSNRKAAQDPYILHRKGAIEKDKKIDNASAGGTRKGGSVIDAAKPPKFDYSTPEGRAKAKEWRDNVKEQETP